MRFSTLIISALSTAAGVGAAKVEPLLVHWVRAFSDASIGDGFEKRQAMGGVGTVPSQCTSACNPVSNEVNVGCPVAACCTPSFETAYYNCLECVGTALNATDYTTAQDDLNSLYTTCVDMGYYLPQLALPGQSASGSGATSATGVTLPSSLGATALTSSRATPTTGTGVSAKHAVGVGGWWLVGVVMGLGVVRGW
ncbi:hypothetical protein BS17DRAFT_766455 [Gyrodon lividus]|nr:hypothetical protein BS17DRAFT_766455 [Gyrodon lividus]